MAWRTLPEPEPRDSVEADEYIRDLITLVFEPVLAAILLSFVVRFLLTFAFFTYISVLLSQTVDASSLVTGILVSLFALVSLASASQAGRFAAMWDVFLVTLFGFLLSGVGMAFIGVFPVYPAIVVGTVLSAVGAGVTGPLQKTLVTQLAPPPLRAGTVSATVIFQNVGSTAGPLFMGFALKRFFVTTAFASFGLAGAVAGIGLLAVAYLKATSIDFDDD